MCVDVDVLQRFARQRGFDGAQHRPGRAVVTANDAEPQVEFGGETDQIFEIFVAARRRRLIRQDTEYRDRGGARGSEDGDRRRHRRRSAAASHSRS